jgi:hypothetical protein
MARLAEYLADLAVLLGERELVHFVTVGDGSARLVHAIEEVAVPKVRARVASARIVDTDSEARRAFENLDHRLREDNASGELREAAETAEAKLLYFPGKNRVVDPIYGPFNQQGQLYGTIIQVGGKQKLANINLQDGEKIYFCEASREMAQQLALLIYKQPVRVHGTGRYIRNADGQWEMIKFRISDFEKLDHRPLAETVERLRAITRKVGLDPDIISNLDAYFIQTQRSPTNRPPECQCYARKIACAFWWSSCRRAARGS